MPPRLASRINSEHTCAPHLSPKTAMWENQGSRMTCCIQDDDCLDSTVVYNIYKLSILFKLKCQITNVESFFGLLMWI